jgi:hypothetical protein
MIPLLCIDAICITQDDNQEKGRQVQMMSEIYKAAQVVVTYTGPEGLGDYAALDFMAKFYNLWRLRKPEYREFTKSLWSGFLESFGELSGDGD